MTSTYELTIIGGGPAGVAGAVYASRKQIKTLMITKEYGGQSSVSTNIRNWIGTDSISGINLAKDLENHVKANIGQYLETKVLGVEKIEQNADKTFTIITDKNEKITTKAVLIASGSSRKKMEAKGADIFEHKGVTYCASCDGPLFSGQDVAVIGGGNAGVETALQLLAYCKTVTMFVRGENLRADETSIDAVMKNPNFKLIKNAQITEVYGEMFVSGMKYKITGNDIENDMKVGGIFVEIGQTPNTDIAKDLVNIDKFNKIIVDPMTQMTSVAGIWAAGDCTNGLYHQNNIAAGDAVKALENIYLWIKSN